jgi:soluble lytic murein transglycosylase-like protein
MTVVDMMNRIQELRQMLGFPTTPVAASGGSDFAGVLQSTLDGSPAAAGPVTGDDVVTAAEKYLGVPYRFGGTNPESGLDCSGFVQRAYADLGIQLPRVAKDQAKEGTAVPSLVAAEPGDLLAFNSPVSHIGIYVGDNKMIVAPHTGDHVKIQTVYAKPTAIRRIVPDAPPAPYTASAAVRPAALTSSVPYAGLFQAAAAKHGVSPTLLAAVAKVESGYNANAVSPAGAQGLMQMMPSTAASLGVDPLDPAQAIDGAARILAGDLKSFNSLPLALAAYNAGGGAVRKYNGIPPYAETQAYVPKVQAAMAELATRGFS